MNSSITQGIASYSALLLFSLSWSHRTVHWSITGGCFCCTVGGDCSEQSNCFINVAPVCLWIQYYATRRHTPAKWALTGSKQCIEENQNNLWKEMENKPRDSHTRTYSTAPVEAIAVAVKCLVFVHFNYWTTVDHWTIFLNVLTRLYGSHSDSLWNKVGRLGDYCPTSFLKPRCTFFCQLAQIWLFGEIQNNKSDLFTVTVM